MSYSKEHQKSPLNFNRCLFMRKVPLQKRDINRKWSIKALSCPIIIKLSAESQLETTPNCNQSRIKRKRRYKLILDGLWIFKANSATFVEVYDAHDN